MSSIPQKQCSKCKQFYPPTLEYFRKASKEKSGLTSRCKTCLHAGDAVYRDNNPDHGKQWYEDHKDGINARRRDEYEQDPEKFRQIGRDYYANNPEPIKARAKRYRDNNPDKVKSLARISYDRLRSNPELWGRELARVAQYYENHPDKKREVTRKVNDKRLPVKREHARKQYVLFPERARAKSHKRRALLMQVGGSHTDDDLKNIYFDLSGRCAYCGISIYWSIKGDVHVDHIIPLSKGGSNNPDNITLACHSCNESKADKDLPDWIATRGW